MIDIGITAPAEAAFLPVYVVRNLTTGQIVETTDPGRALVTGKWLRALVSFYNRRFSIGLTDAEMNDLIAFLRSL
jgi:hypothetical protein